MIEIIKKNKCTGCGACLSACPKHAISMFFDEEGFEYPIINHALCIDCGVCKKTCPILHFDDHYSFLQKTNTIQRGFAARNKNYKERIKSSSGGVFVVLANLILEKQGIVVGVAYDENYNTKYKIIDKIENLPQLQGSKYLQCKADTETFKTIKAELQNGRMVLFSGLACQVEGLHSYLGKVYNNLYCVDLICMGIPSAQVWQKYLQTYFKGETITAVNFKDKSAGWNHFRLAIKTDKQDFKQYGMINPYFRSMFNAYNMRRSCFVCPFKRMERTADITLADCWGANSLVPEIDDNKGLSAVIVHTDKGEGIWELVSSKIEKVELTLEDIIKGNMNLIENRTCNETKRNKFYYFLNNGHMERAFHYAETNGKHSLTIIERAYNIIIQAIRKIKIK